MTGRVLHHLPLLPLCRKVRVALHEKALEAELRPEAPWERREELLQLNPAAEVPVLVEPDGTTLCDSVAICEYLEETYPDRKLLPGDARERAEARRLVAWFDGKFHREVSVNLLEEKLLKRIQGRGEPNASAIRAGAVNIRHHLDYVGYLVERRNWLAGDWFSFADIAAAAQLSAIDYLGDVPWEQNEAAKDWYARIKSRPSFRTILSDHIAGLPPPKHYADLDF